MIKYYFALQFKIIQRHLTEWGIQTWVAFPIFVIAFILFSNYFFLKVEFAPEAYLILGLSVLSGLSTTNRKGFLLSFLSTSNYYKIRMIENTVCTLPFVIFLLIKLHWIYAGLMLFISILLSKMDSGFTIGKSIPTPFSKSPFEFPVGFRKTLPFILLSYSLTIIGLKVDNFNLAVFSLGLIFLVCLSYYSFLEKQEYVWIHAQQPKTFLLMKIKTAIFNAFVICLPSLLLLTVFEFTRLLPVALLFFGGELFLVSIILSKYTNYPREMNVPNGILLGLGLFFPPLLLALIPFFYNQSVASLKKVLI